MVVWASLALRDHGRRGRKRERRRKRKRDGEGDVEKEDSLSPVSNITKCNCCLVATLSKHIGLS